MKKLFKFILTSIFIAFIAVGYVHQRVEIFKTGYSLQKNRTCLGRLVDRNADLMYNLSRLESPRNLLASLDSESVRFANHRAIERDRYKVARVAADKNVTYDSFFPGIFDLFTQSAEAKSQK